MHCGDAVKKSKQSGVHDKMKGNPHETIISSVPIKETRSLC
jgi:hypothetical protein